MILIFLIHFIYFRVVKTRVEVEDIDERQENAEPRITVIEEFEVVLEWNNGTVSMLNV